MDRSSARKTTACFLAAAQADVYGSRNGMLRRTLHAAQRILSIVLAVPAVKAGRGAHCTQTCLCVPRARLHTPTLYTACLYTTTPATTHTTPAAPAAQRYARFRHRRSASISRVPLCCILPTSLRSGGGLVEGYGCWFGRHGVRTRDTGA